MVYFMIFLAIDLIVWAVVFFFFLKPAPPVRQARNDGDTDDSDDGLSVEDVPELDLPPGVTLPVDDEELVETY